LVARQTHDRIRRCMIRKSKRDENWLCANTERSFVGDQGFDNEAWCFRRDASDVELFHILNVLDECKLRHQFGPFLRNILMVR
jgi:hypothetical protein